MKPIPLSEPERLTEVTDGRVSHDLHLPVGADESRVFLHPGRLKRLAHSAGAKSLHLVFDDTLPRPDYTDIESIGGGMAVLKGLKKPGYMGTFEYDDSNNPGITGVGAAVNNSLIHLSRFPADSLTLRLPVAAIEESVQEDKNNRRGPLDENMWAKYTDRALRTGFTKACAYRFGMDGPTDKPSTRLQEFLLLDLAVPQFGTLALWLQTRGDPALASTPLALEAFWYGVLPGLVHVITKAEMGESIFRAFWMSGVDKVPRTLLRAKVSGKFITSMQS
jgi:hypothetical protein